MINNDYNDNNDNNDKNDNNDDNVALLRAMQTFKKR